MAYYNNPNTWWGIYPPYNGTNPYTYPTAPAPAPTATQQYMISVDGEMAAKAWQMPGNAMPNTIIPLWDLDGEHVYFKTTDAYGRMNPIRKGRIVFDDEPQRNLQSGESQMQGPGATPYLTKDEFKTELDQMKNEIQSTMSALMHNNQNGSENRNNNRQNGGVNRT